MRLVRTSRSVRGHPSPVVQVTIVQAGDEALLAKVVRAFHCLLFRLVHGDRQAAPVDVLVETPAAGSYQQCPEAIIPAVSASIVMPAPTTPVHLRRRASSVGHEERTQKVQTHTRQCETR